MSDSYDDLPTDGAGSQDSLLTPRVARGLQTLSAAHDFLIDSMIERRVEAWLAMVALVSRQHLFLLGPPGTAKSLLARLVKRALGPETPYFEILLTRFTMPDEVFGPIRIKRMIEHEEYTRKVERYLPWAVVAFLDEIWKSSSAVLNSLLTITNERAYDNGGQRLLVPLQTLYAASNELPQDSSLSALYDRFLLRREVSPVSVPAKLLDLPDLPDPPPIECLGHVQDACRRVVLPELVRETMVSIKECLVSEGVQVGDRRFRESASLVRASAILAGRSVADLSDLHVLSHCYWDTPDQQQSLVRTVNERVEYARLFSSLPRHPVREPEPEPPPPPLRPDPSAPLSPWEQLIYDLSGLTEAAIQADARLHDRIHQALVSPEAQGQDPVRRTEVLRLVSIKQRLVTYGHWKGPPW